SALIRENYCRNKNGPRRAFRNLIFLVLHRSLYPPHHNDSSPMKRLHPRSPYEKLGGYVHLPRLIDKARLHRKGLLDGYNYKTVGFDKHLLAFVKLDGNAFEEVANRLDDDAAILKWVQKNGTQHSP